MRHRLVNICRRKKNSSPNINLLEKIVPEMDESEKLLIFGDLNGHVGAGVEGVHLGLGLVKEMWKVK